MSHVAKATTENPEEYQRELIVISDPEKIRILMDDTRREILQVMRTTTYRDGKKVVDMSVGEIADALDTAPQRIYHHIDKLIEAGFVIKSREEKKTRSTVTYYKRTAKGIIIAYEEQDLSPQMYEKRSMNYLKSLSEAFDLDFSTDELEVLGDHLSKLWKNNAKFLEAISEHIHPNFKGKDIDHMIRFMRGVFEYKDGVYNEHMKVIADIILPKMQNS